MVPDVQYNDFNAAKGVLEGLGLKIEKKEEESDVVQEGKIISQSIKANTRTLKGDTIVLTVSKGSKVLADAQKKTDKFNNSTSFTTNSDGKVESITVDDKVEVPVKIGPIGQLIHQKLEIQIIMLNQKLNIEVVSYQKHIKQLSLVVLHYRDGLIYLRIQIIVTG
ncbi:PASTA domain-containing protein [Coprobacillaceae bacterium CR2/5/TPMF4]|nr:PASTA domain-containing protein [Coprobacillaceae bacterium CR2/5/TPMF4]